MTPTINAADLFCGAGGTSTGMLMAAREMGFRLNLTAVNHWPLAIQTHLANHPWGPLDRCGKPIKDDRGKTFAAFLQALESLGYTVDHRVICAANFGDATTRKRLFIQARRLGGRITWPNPTHSKAGDNGLPRWRAAREVIDWSLASQSIFTRKRALAPRTIERIAAGIRKFWGPAAEPFLVMLRGPVNEPDRFARSVDDPCPTVTAGGTHLGLVEPFIVQTSHSGTTGRGRYVRELNEPLPTVTTINDLCVVSPFISPLEGVHRGNAARSVDDPLPTVLASRGGGHVVQPFLIPQQSKGIPRGVSDQIMTIATKGAIALVEPFLVKYFRTGRANSIDRPLDTVTTKPRFGLVEPMIVQDRDGNRYMLDIRFRMLQPHELAAAMGFPDDYQFFGTKDQVVKQIGNAVPAYTACALTKGLVAA